MAKFTTLILATMALVAGIQAATPCAESLRGTKHCGARIVADGCYAATELATFTDKDKDVLKVIYQIEADGEIDVQGPECPGTCVENGDGRDASCA